VCLEKFLAGSLATKPKIWSCAGQVACQADVLLGGRR